MTALALLDSGAVFSADRRHRYHLWRRWGDGPQLMVVGLNPSTADENVDDPTIRRCLGFARLWKFSGLVMMNVYAYRSTDPRALKAVPYADAIGPQNDNRLMAVAWAIRAVGGSVLAAWGNHIGPGRSAVVQAALRHSGGVACLGLTKSGEPKHPLYLRSDTRPVAYLGDGGLLVSEWPDDQR